MEKLEKVEQVRKACEVSYEEAVAALEASDYDILDAIVAIERSRKPVEPTIRYAAAAPAPEPEPASEPEPVAEPAAAEPAPEPAFVLVESAEPAAAEPAPDTTAQAKQAKKEKAKKTWETFCARIKKVFRAGLDTQFVATRNGEAVVEVPVLFVVLGMLVWGATLWIMVAGLFFGFRYRVEASGFVALGVNEAMDKAADVAGDIKENLS